MKYLAFTKSNKIKLKRRIDEKLIFILAVLTCVLKGLQLSLKQKFENH